MNLNNTLRHNNATIHRAGTATTRVHYSAVQQKLETSNEPQDNSTQIIYVYCSPRLKSTMSFLWKLVLLTYVIAIPIFVYLLHQESESNTFKLRSLEAEYDVKMKHVDLDQHTRVKRAINDGLNADLQQHMRVKRAVSNESLKVLHQAYSSGYKTSPVDLEKNINKKLKWINNTVTRYEKRMSTLNRAEEWVLFIYKKYNNENATFACDCARTTLVEKCAHKRKIQIKTGPKGPKGETGERGERGVQGPPGKPGHVTKCDSAKKLAVTYVKWGANRGNQTCGSKSQLVYQGYIGGAKHGGSGSNYLCLPKQPHISGNQKHLNKQSEITNKLISHCAVCQSNRKSVVLMVPGSNSCPSKEWTKEYEGDLNAANVLKTQYICAASVDTGLALVTPSTIPGYDSMTPLRCVVCTK